MGKKKTNDDAPGWDAIDAALQKLYPRQEPYHLALGTPASLGGDACLEGVSLYASDKGIPHWHAVSYGMSELFAKESKDKQWSGLGFEFTFRVARGPKEKKAPDWPAGALEALAGYVVRSGNLFAPGHRMDTGNPIGPDRKSKLSCVAFANDPELGVIKTPHGKLRFPRLIGITPDELAAMKSSTTAKILKVMARENPLLITDLKRRSLLDDPDTRKRL